jgi:hypothetical protein
MKKLFIKRKEHYNHKIWLEWRTLSVTLEFRRCPSAGCVVRISDSDGARYEGGCLLACSTVLIGRRARIHRPHDEGSMYLWNVGKLLPEHGATTQKTAITSQTNCGLLSLFHELSDKATMVSKVTVAIMRSVIIVVSQTRPRSTLINSVHEQQVRFPLFQQYVPRIALFPLLRKKVFQQLSLISLLQQCVLTVHLEFHCQNNMLQLLPRAMPVAWIIR